MRLSVATLLALSFGLSVVSCGLLMWMIVDPQQFFAGAYAEKGERGDPGPRGPRGREGPAGPVGPDAAAAVEDVSSEVSDLDDRVTDLEGQSDELDARTSAVEDTLSEMCYQFALSIAPLVDVYDAAC